MSSSPTPSRLYCLKTEQKTTLQTPWVPLVLSSCVLWAFALPLHAQGTALGQPAASPQVNGFAEQLRPARRKASQVIDNRPYAPIKKPTDEGQIPEIEMFVGESRVFPAPGVARIAVGNGAILNAAALDGKEIILFANAIGTSSLFVWNEDGRHQRVKINIVPGDTGRYAREIAAFLSTIPKARASIIGDKVIVEGTNLTDADLARIDMLSKRYPQIVNFTNPLGFETMVMLDVKVVEFPTTELKELGLRWNATGGAAIGGIWSPIRRGNDGPYQINIQTGNTNVPPIVGAGGGPVVLPSGLNVLSVLNLGLNATLDALAQQGRTTILAQPQLSARNGSKASFLAGGEIPYGVEGTEIVFKPYGIRLDIEPRVDSSGNVRATIDTEVSNVDRSLSTPLGPALLKRQTKTEFNVRSGETIVLSGLIQRETATDIDKVPGLGDVPIIGALFRSKRFQNRETELVVFVTPTVIDPSSPGITGRVQRTNERLEERLGQRPYLTDPLQPGRDIGRPDLPDPATTATPPSPPQSAAPAVSAVTASGTPAQAAPQLPIAAAAIPSASTELQAVSFERPEGSTVLSLVNGLIIRSQPSQNSEPLLQVGRNAVLTLRDDTEQTPHSAYWLPVQTGQISGWVANHFVEASKLTLSVPPRSRELAQATPVSLTRALPPNSPAALTLGDVAVQGKLVVVAKHLPLLLTPDINAPASQFVTEGQVVERLAIAPRGAWTAVESQGQRGWLSTPWLQPVKD